MRPGNAAMLASAIGLFKPTSKRGIEALLHLRGRGDTKGEVRNEDGS